MKIDPRKIYRLKGRIQHYDWGGYDFIPRLLGIENEAHLPYAEYWMGSHPAAPSLLLDDGQEIALDQVLREHPVLLGQKVEEKFGQLPYLLKVLDVKQMLSIQVHPSKEGAEAGFDAEEERGLPAGSPQRNYKDRNHKPEVLVALSEFWLLHGFKPAETLKATLNAVPQFRSLVGVFETGGYEGLYTHVMKLPQPEVDALLVPVVQREVRRRSFHESEKDEPGYWVGEYYLNKPANNIDKGVFAIYFLNIVCLAPGEALFQSAGVPHAYLQGQNVELMANSDNVLRGGLTSKHVDVAELIRHTRFEPVVPEILHGNKLGDETRFEFPVDEFSISRLALHPAQAHTARADAPEIMLCLEGELAISAANTVELKKGDACISFPGTDYTMTAAAETVLFRASVPG